MPARLTAALRLGLLALLVTGCAARAPVQGPARGDAQMIGASNDASPTPPAAVAVPQKACANCPTPDPDFAPTREEVPADVENTPDAEVIDEPRSRYGNPKDYEALGKRYTVMPTLPKGFREKGRASWYGKKFHGRRTANGETYDMFKMTAAHKTLPLPSYVRVTSKVNGRSVVVRVNDRGPFHPGRIIDLSYAAAARLDLLKVGSAEVEIEALSSKQGAVVSEREEGKPRYLEVGRFADPIDAVGLREQLTALGFTDTEFLQTTSPAGDGLENILRIGPFASFSKLEEARVKLGSKNITAIPVAD